MELDSVGAMRVAQLHAHVAIDDDVPLDDAVPGVEPEEDGAAPFPGPALNPDEHVVADDPVLGIHHIDTGDVVALGDIRLIVLEPLGAVVVEQAILNAAALRADRRPILRRDLDTLDAPLPDIVNDAVVNRQVLDVGLGVDLEAVPLDVLNGQVSHGHARASAEAQQLAVHALRAVEDHPLAPTRSTAQRHVVRSNLHIPRQVIQPIREQNRLPRFRLRQRRNEPPRIGNLNDRPRPLGQRRRLRKPPLHRRLQRRRQPLASPRQHRQNHQPNIRPHLHSPRTSPTRFAFRPHLSFPRRACPRPDRGREPRLLRLGSGPLSLARVEIGFAFLGPLF